MSALHHLSVNNSTGFTAILRFLCQAREMFPSLASVTLSRNDLGESVFSTGLSAEIPFEDKSSVFPYLKHLTIPCPLAIKTPLAGSGRFSNRHWQAEQEPESKLRKALRKLLIATVESCVSLESLTVIMQFPCPDYERFFSTGNRHPRMPFSEFFASIPPSVTRLDMVEASYEAMQIPILGIDERHIILAEVDRLEYRHPSRKLVLYCYPCPRMEPSTTDLDQLFNLSAAERSNADVTRTKRRG